MRQFLMVLAVLMVAGPALAAGPYIVSDPDPEATLYRMRLSSDGGVTWGPWTEGPPVGQALKFDLGGVARGTYKGEAQAGGNVEVTDSTSGQVSTVFQWSSSAPFSLRVTPGKSPIHIKAATD